MTQYRNPEAIVETAWLEAHLADPTLRIFDCTVHLLYDEAPPGQPYKVKSGREDYDRGHIPGADFLDLQGELSDNASPWNFTLPSAEHFAAAMERHGVGEGTRVILYSSSSPQWATRIWWMLRAFGFDNAALLNGGFQKWKAEGRALSTAPPPTRPPARFAPAPRAGLFTGKEEVLSAIGAPEICTLNALPPELHRGENARYGRAGRIPGSVNVPAGHLLDPATNTFRPADEVAALFQATGIKDKAGKVIIYCGGGIAATLDAFLLHQLGYENVTVYDNSMSQWAKDDSLPMEAG
jgi:thiosulfate/3-mercaptopyruvate sulfurtransferase